MTTYNTRTLAAAIMGDELVDANAKSATRTLRKFLRDELGEGKAVVGKGARYSLDYNKRELTALTKKFRAWEIAQQEAAEARKIALAAAKAPKATITPEEPIADETDIEDDAPEGDDEPMTLEGPTDDEIAEMLADDEEIDEEV
jgi:hypothetical protein